KRPQSLMRRLWKWLIRLILIFVLGSILWVLAYRFINPPITFTMLGDVFAGRGAEREWMPITQIDRDMVRAAIAAEDSKFCTHHRHRGGAARGGVPAPQEARSGRASGLHPALRQHHHSAHRGCRTRWARCLHLQGCGRAGEQGAAGSHQEAAADPG